MVMSYELRVTGNWRRERRKRVDRRGSQTFGLWISRSF